jgi:hypothetical protein
VGPLRAPVKLGCNRKQIPYQDKIRGIPVRVKQNTVLNMLVNDQEFMLPQSYYFILYFDLYGRFQGIINFTEGMLVGKFRRFIVKDICINQDEFITIESDTDNMIINKRGTHDA